MKIKYHLFSLLFPLAFILSCSVTNQRTLPEFSHKNIILKKIPLFIEKKNNNAVELELTVPEGEEPLELESIVFHLGKNSQTGFLESVVVQHAKTETSKDSLSVFGETKKFNSEQIKIRGSLTLEAGRHLLSFNFRIKDNASLEKSFRIKNVELDFGAKENLILETPADFAYRPAKVLRAAGQDNCDTYRIPGLVTTNNGTLIAVYDNRYDNVSDLQGNIDIGMSRSTDGGQSWEPMRVIMDMGEWGGRPENSNGIGDPCVLYDHITETLWVAALWMSGPSPDAGLWWDSKPGMTPEETGQFMLTKSTDDGLSWSDPINITKQIKDPEWQLLLQGPGRGITLDDGTLVFPAQFKADLGEKAIDGGQYTCHSTIIYSHDSGETWHIGTGAKPNTTESQVAQLADGSLMLNMRDDRNRKIKDETNGRAVAVTSDLGKTWTIHPSSNSVLPEPNCMASLISADVEIDGQKQKVLFFSNPNNREARTNLTIKTSLDSGNTWPEKNQAELNETRGFGYSCMTMVDENTVGILYEGVKELYFQKISVRDILGGFN
ncbi:exo-alpha-sialidase [Mariniphaga sediminis]|uniref:exo-alpha-sialidase n=1 Tax=Mariniphaga sediminis TaxID=1628158 RepID=A0A399D582_9BACT|nr:sialidase family protein [Mariniphaga sediminis]RIH66809.1 exo-alpha-sialidase [Mariniphaga sediminis]